MPFYQMRGRVPDKRHTQFRNPDGGLYWEELISREGFGYVCSNVYHLQPPTAVARVGDWRPLAHAPAAAGAHRPHHLRSGDAKSGGDAIAARRLLLHNDDLRLSVAHADCAMGFLYRNACADEMLYVQSGGGVLHSNFGDLELRCGDYAIIPRGIIWRLAPSGDMRLLVLETTGALETPGRYRNRLGQLLEHAPYCERDIRTPQLQQPQQGGAEVLVRLPQGLQMYEYRNHPCDLVGWDGYYYPWVLNIEDFMPITGKIHQPPPVHQTFQAPGLVVCSFVPRLFDYHPQAIPAPYAHSNVDSDEVIYYSRGDFMSRKGVAPESITWHPMGLPHGPQPGKIEASLGAEGTEEYAVMVDSFKPLQMAAAADDMDDPDYPYSWLEK